MAIKAVTFDLWDTIVFDESDEPRRQEMGLRSKYDERRHLIWRALNGEKPLPIEDVSLAYGVADAAFNNLWKSHSINWTLEERLEVILKGLNRTLSDGDKAGVIKALGAMEVEVPPDPIPGIAEALEELSGRYKLCIVSDAIVTPGTGLRELLAKHGLKDFFSGFAFSDEVGHSKPHADMFKSAARQMGVEFSEMVHIGDRDHNDIKGPQALGMKAVLFTAGRDADRETTSADAICASHAELPAIIDGLNG